MNANLLYHILKQLSHQDLNYLECHLKQVLSDELFDVFVKIKHHLMDSNSLQTLRKRILNYTKKKTLIQKQVLNYLAMNHKKIDEFDQRFHLAGYFLSHNLEQEGIKLYRKLIDECLKKENSFRIVEICKSLLHYYMKHQSIDEIVLYSALMQEHLEFLLIQNQITDACINVYRYNYNSIMIKSIIDRFDGEVISSIAMIDFLTLKKLYYSSINDKKGVLNINHDLLDLIQTKKNIFLDQQKYIDYMLAILGNLSLSYIDNQDFEKAYYYQELFKQALINHKKIEDVHQLYLLQLKERYLIAIFNLEELNKISTNSKYWNVPNIKMASIGTLTALLILDNKAIILDYLKFLKIHLKSIYLTCFEYGLIYLMLKINSKTVENEIDNLIKRLYRKKEATEFTTKVLSFLKKKYYLLQKDYALDHNERLILIKFCKTYKSELQKSGIKTTLLYDYFEVFLYSKLHHKSIQDSFKDFIFKIKKPL